MYKKYLDTALNAIKAAGKILVDNFDNIHNVKQKSENVRDLVSDVDFLIEKRIIALIKNDFPDHSINSEESNINNVGSSYIWYIDPIDGTVNYIKGIKLCAISLALEIEGSLLLGIIYNPFSKELFHAVRGKGAFINGSKIQVSKKSELKQGLYIAAFSHKFSNNKLNEYKLFADMNDCTYGVLRIGTAALALAYLASGKIDGFWGGGLYIWDIAAGVLLVKEANGDVIIDKSGTSNEVRFISATNGTIQKKLIKKIRSYKILI